MQSVMQLEIEKYANMTPSFGIEYGSAIDSLKADSLVFFDVHDMFIEDFARLPSFAKCFYEIVTDNKIIPKQAEFCCEYIDKNIRNIMYDNSISYGNKDSLCSGLTARLHRTYPSLVRDLMFNLYVWNECRDVYAMYNLELDYKHGIDCLVEKDGLLFGLCLFTDTARSVYYRGAKKTVRHTEFDNVIMIEAPLNLDDAFVCGDFKLYDEKYIDRVICDL